MVEFLTKYDLSGMITSLMAGDLNLLTGFIWFIVASIVSMIAGAIGGMLLAGEDLGYNFGYFRWIIWSCWRYSRCNFRVNSTKFIE